MCVCRPAAVRAQLSATEAALHRDLYDPVDGQYSNRLYNGTFYKRWAPTVFTPMLLNSTPPERIPAMATMMGEKTTFCVADEPGSEAPTFLWRMVRYHCACPHQLVCSGATCRSGSM